MNGKEITELSIQWLRVNYPELVEHYDDNVTWNLRYGTSSPGQPGFNPYERDLVDALREMKARLARVWGEDTAFGDIAYETAEAALGLEKTKIPEAFTKGWE